MAHVDDQRVAFPMTDRMAHPGVSRRRVNRVEVNCAAGASKFKRHLDLVRALRDLKRIWHVHGPRNSWHVASDFGITIQPVLGIVFLFRGGLGLVWNRIAFDDARSGRYAADRARSEERRVGKECRSRWS